MHQTRYQVLCEDWLAEYINDLTKRYDLSVSSVIRSHFCLAVVGIISLMYPEYKPDLSFDKEVAAVINKASKVELDEADLHRLLSKVIFEARKAIEFRYSKEKNLKEK